MEQYTVYDPGEGYRLVSIGERLQADDDVHFMGDTKWTPLVLGDSVIGREVNPQDDDNEIPFGYYRRKILQSSYEELIVTQIAKDKLNIETLETRNSDTLDFHDIAVWVLKDALLAAYEHGAADAKKS